MMSGSSLRLKHDIRRIVGRRAGSVPIGAATH